jgi:hypothetical protein
MAIISLAKALKIKNRITSKITSIKKEISAHNSYLVDKDIPVDEIKLQVDVNSSIKELEKLTAFLVKVKAEINKSNSDSADLIFELSETKGLIAFYENLDCSQNLSSYFRPQSNDIKRVQIDVIQQNLIVKTLIKKSEKLQDQLDEFNAVKKVVIDDEILEL